MHRLLPIIALLVLSDGCSPYVTTETSVPNAKQADVMQVPIERISENQRDHYLKVGGLPGNELNGEIMKDTDEYDELVNRIIVRLERYGKVGRDNDRPYYMDRYAPADYFPWVEVKGVEFVTLQLVADLYTELRSMPAKYRIDVCNAMPYWNDDLNILIEHDRIYWFADDNTAKRVGLQGLQSISVSQLNSQSKNVR